MMYPRKRAKNKVDWDEMVSFESRKITTIIEEIDSEDEEVEPESSAEGNVMFGSFPI